MEAVARGVKVEANPQTGIVFARDRFWHLTNLNDTDHLPLIQAVLLGYSSHKAQCSSAIDALTCKAKDECGISHQNLGWSYCTPEMMQSKTRQQKKRNRFRPTSKLPLQSLTICFGKMTSDRGRMKNTCSATPVASEPRTISKIVFLQRPWYPLITFITFLDMTRF